MRRGVSWAEDLTETISTPPDDDGVKNDFVNDDDESAVTKLLLLGNDVFEC